jgi:hypothetical protein
MEVVKMLRKRTMVATLGLILGMELMMTEPAYSAWWRFWEKKAEAETVTTQTLEKEETETESDKMAEEKGTQTVEAKGALLEEYVSKEIIAADWGKELGKIGIYTSEKEILGPVAMDVDREGNIYIFDSVNWRVVIYNNKGSYTSTVNLEEDKIREPYRGGRGKIKVDSEGNMYIRSWPLLRKYNSKGKLVKGYLYYTEEYPKGFSKKFSAYLKDLDERGILEIVKPERFGFFMGTIFPSKYLPVSGYLDGVPTKEISSHYERTEKVIFYMAPGGIGWWTYPWVPSTLTKKWKEFTISHPDYIEHNYIVIATEEGEIEKIITLPQEGISEYHPLKEDYQGYIYIYADKHNKEECVYKYNYLGELVAEIKVKPPYFYGSHGWYVIYPFISWNGEIYQIYWDANKLDEGFRVIRWERREE